MPNYTPNGLNVESDDGSIGRGRALSEWADNTEFETAYKGLQWNLDWKTTDFVGLEPKPGTRNQRRLGPRERRT